jgi:lipopolysaccharide export system permease protein
MSLLQRYLLRQLVRPFGLGILVVTFLLTMDFLFDYLDLFLGKGIALGTVLWLFTLSLGWILALSIPCGVLVGVLITYGRLAQDNEIVALRASGIPVFRVMAPALSASVWVAVLLTLFNNYVLPDMNHAFANLMLSINKKRPTAEIREGVFIDDFTGYNMFIGNLDDRTGQMRDVLIYDFSRRDEPPRTILAQRGRLEFDEAEATLRLHLENGEIHEAARGDAPIYRKMEFANQTLNIQGVREALERTQQRSRGQREMSIHDMRQRISELREENAQYAQRSQRILEQIGVTGMAELPGMRPKPTWVKALAARLGRAERPSVAPPDSFWTPARRRLAEETKIAYMQAQAAAKKINQYQVEIQKKFSIPFACIAFVLVGAPLGMRARRGGLAAGFLSAGFFMFYYLCLVGGEQLADRQHLTPWIAMWLPNAALTVLGIVLTLHICEVRIGRRPSALPTPAAGRGDA